MLQFCCKLSDASGIITISVGQNSQAVKGIGFALTVLLCLSWSFTQSLKLLN